MPAWDMAMEKERQNDQTGQEEKGQPLSRRDSFHIFSKTVTVSVSRVRNLLSITILQNLFYRGDE